MLSNAEDNCFFHPVKCKLKSKIWDEVKDFENTDFIKKTEGRQTELAQILEKELNE